MQSLRDKLLKAGLVSEDAAKKAETDAATKPARAASTTNSSSPPASQRPPPRRDDRPPPPRRDDRPKPSFPPRAAAPPPRREDVIIAARLPKLPPMQGSKEAHRLQARKQLEQDKALRELVMTNTVATDVGATPFYFVTRKNKLRRLELTEAQAKQLESGALAVVERPDPDKIEHALVPAAIAEEVLKLSQRAVRFLNKEGVQVGFLTDDEISSRASEADVPEAPETKEGAAVDAPNQPAEVHEQPADADTFITIKRAPLA